MTFRAARSERGKTHAARHLPDDVPEGVKGARLQQVIAAFREGLAMRYAARNGALDLVRTYAFLTILHIEKRTCRA